MDERRLKGILGLSVRARQTAFGGDACRKALESGQYGILLLDEQISDNTRLKYQALCGRTGSRLIILPAGLLETATGRENMAMAVRRGNFSEQVESCL